MNISKINNINFSSRTNAKKNSQKKENFLTREMLKTGFAIGTFLIQRAEKQQQQIAKKIITQEPKKDMFTPNKDSLEKTEPEEDIFTSNKGNNEETKLKEDVLIPAMDDSEETMPEEFTRASFFRNPQTTEAQHIFEVQDINPIAEIEKSEETILANKQANEDFLDKRIEKERQLYSDFGIDEELKEEFLKLNPDLVKEIDDDHFLSIILAPSYKISASMDELLKYECRKPSMINNLCDRIFDNTKGAKKRRGLERKIGLYRTIGGVSSHKARIDNFRALERNFTPEEIHKIFNNKEKRISEQLLRWLVGFDTQEYHNWIVKNIKVSIS